MAVTALTPQQKSGEISRFEDAIVRAIRALTTRLDVNGVCAATLDALEQLFEARSCWIFLQADARHLRTAGCRGVDGHAFADLKIPVDEGIVAQAFRTRQPVFVANPRLEHRWFDAERVHSSPLQAVFAVPLLYADRALGVIVLDVPRLGDGAAPSGAHLARLEAIAGQAAIAIANARLYETSEEDRRRLRRLLEQRDRFHGHIAHLEEHIKTSGAFGEIVGASECLRECVSQAALAAPADTTVLLLGETGSGKEMIARFIHERSARGKGPFVPVNCAALPEALVESELFGHEKGAFTGAVARKPGRFEIAHGGTLFLDEIGDLPKDAQAKLLRVLQDHEVQRVGSTRAVPVDVRVVAATNQDLETAIERHAFRADLYYRLSVFPLRIPPLRERNGDIASLARHFVARFAAKFRRPIDGLSPAALMQLEEYDWPGNVRELQNVIERAVVLTPSGVIDEHVIRIFPKTRPAEPSASGAIASAAAPEPSSNEARKSPRVSLADAERAAILAALEHCLWRISGHGGAAERLALKPTTLHAKMKRLGIHRPAS